MAADNSRKLFDGAGITGCSYWLNNKAKKKRLATPSKLCLNSHISLEWNSKGDRVVAKKEQIAISKRSYGSVSKSALLWPDILVDILPIPGDVFELHNLSDVLTYDIWENCLSETERIHLSQFLPDASDTDNVYQLLNGANFHFGNPMIKWGVAVCLGSCHPDAILHTAGCLNTAKKVYYSQIKKYHNVMMKYLLKLKKICHVWDDLEVQDLPNLWRIDDKCQIIMNPADQATVVSDGAQIDGSKYMSYFKVSKKQRRLVENLKQSGNSITSLNYVIGDVDVLHIQPYAEFVKEEEEKRHEYWLQIMKNEISTTFSNWRHGQCQRRQLIKCLESELKAKFNESRKGNQDRAMDKMFCEGDCRMRVETVNGKQQFSGMDMDQKGRFPMGSCSQAEDRKDYICVSSAPSAPHGKDYAVNRCDAPQDHATHVHASSGNMGAHNPMSIGTAASGVWSAINLQQQCFDTSPGSGYTSSPRGTRQTQLIDLEVETHGEDEQANSNSFCYFPNDHNGLLQSLFKSDKLSRDCHLGQKEASLDVKPSKILTEMTSLLDHQEYLQQSSVLLEQPLNAQPVEREYFTDAKENISAGIFTDEREYFIPRPRHLTFNNFQECDVHSPDAPPMAQAHMSNESLTPNWCSGRKQFQGLWTGASARASMCSLESLPLNEQQHMLPGGPQARSIAARKLQTRNMTQPPFPPTNYLMNHTEGSSVMTSSLVGWLGLPNPSTLNDPVDKTHCGPWGS